jgi:hypothetical protein
MRSVQPCVHACLHGKGGQRRHEPGQCLNLTTLCWLSPRARRCMRCHLGHAKVARVGHEEVQRPLVPEQRVEVVVPATKPCPGGGSRSEQQRVQLATAGKVWELPMSGASRNAQHARSASANGKAQAVCCLERPVPAQ